MSSDDQNTTSILVLENDLFHQIARFLNPLDLCSLGNTCRRLRELSDFWCKRQSDTFRLTESAWDRRSYFDAERLIRAFGPFIKKLAVHQRHFNEDSDAIKLMPLINQYCEQLVELKLVGFTLDVETIIRCDRLFKNLRRLALDEWFGKELELAYVLDKCVSLKDLELIRMEGVRGSDFGGLRLEHLESFTMSACDDFDYQFVKNFLLTNRQLTKIQYLRPKFYTGDFMGDVATALPNLKELRVKFSYKFDNPVAAPILKMHFLAKLQIDFLLVRHETAEKLLENITVLKHLRHLLVASCYLTDRISQLLCAMKDLKTLSLIAWDYLDNETCKTLAIKLVNLSEVHIMQCKGVTLIDMKEFVTRLANLKRITYVRCRERNKEVEASVMADEFLSLLKVCIGKPKKAIFPICMDREDLNDIKDFLKFTGEWTIVSEHSKIVKVSELEEEQLRMFYMYGYELKSVPYYFANYDEEPTSDDDYSFDSESDSD